MSDSLILRTAARVLLPVLALLALFMLLRGHNEPGGGFIGGLLAAAGLALYQLAYGVAAARRLFRVDPLRVVATGLVLAVGAGLLPLLVGRPLLSGMWLKTPLPGVGKLGTPLVFDIGVCLVVLGTVVLMIMTLEARPETPPSLQTANDERSAIPQVHETEEPRLPPCGSTSRTSSQFSQKERLAAGLLGEEGEA